MKRIIALLTICCVLFGVFPVYADDISAKATSSEVFLTDLEYDNAVDFLTKLGILDEKGSLYKKPADESLTRAEFALLMYNAYNGKLAYDGGNYFSDIAEDSKVRTAVNALAQAGILKGSGSGEFHPNDEILLYDAAAIMLRAMGYIDTVGGGNAAFVSRICSRYDLLDRDTFDDSSSAKTSVLKMFYSLLGESVFSTESIEKSGGNTGYKYYSSDDTMLYLYFGIYKTEGVLNSNGIVNVKGNAADDKTAVVDGISMRISAPIDIMAGTKVTAYYTDIGVKELVAVYTSDDNECKTLTTFDIGDYNDGVYEYTDGNKTKKITIDSKKVTVVYNNELLNTSDKKYMLPEYGVLSFIDNNSDGKYEIVDIKSYVSFVVDWAGASGDDHALNGTSGMVYISDKEPCVIKSADGAKLTAEDITSLMTVSCITVERNGKKYAKEVIVSQKHINAPIDSVKTGGANFDSVSVNGEDYYLMPNSPSLQAAISATVYGNDLYLDFMDTVVAVKYTTSMDGAAAGFLVEAGAESVKLDSGTVLRIYDEIGRLKDYKLAKRITLNGSMVKNPVPSLFSANEGEIILFRVNEQDEVCYIDTAAEYSDSTSVNTDDKLIKGADDNGDNSGRGLYYKESEKSFGGRVSCTLSTLMFCVPPSPKTASEVDFSILSFAELEDAQYYPIQAYHTNPESPVADIVVIKDDLRVHGTTNVAVLTDVGTAVNSEGEETFSLSLHDRSGVYTYPSKSKNVVNAACSENTSDTAKYKVQKGDLVRYHVNAKGEVDALLLVYDESEQTLFSSNTITNSFSYGLRTFAAIPYDSSYGYVKFADYSRLADIDTIGKNEFEYISYGRIVKTFKISHGRGINGNFTVTEISPSEIRTYKTNGTLLKAVVNVVNQSRTTVFIYDYEE